ncbi:hypothetical protein WJX73_010730, partial [Symbiochloris irregularis]
MSAQSSLLEDSPSLHGTAAEAADVLARQLEDFADAGDPDTGLVIVIHDADLNAAAQALCTGEGIRPTKAARAASRAEYQLWNARHLLGLDKWSFDGGAEALAAFDDLDVEDELCSDEEQAACLQQWGLDHRIDPPIGPLQQPINHAAGASGPQMSAADSPLGQTAPLAPSPPGVVEEGNAASSPRPAAHQQNLAPHAERRASMKAGHAAAARRSRASRKQEARQAPPLGAQGLRRAVPGMHAHFAYRRAQPAGQVLPRLCPAAPAATVEADQPAETAIRAGPQCHHQELRAHAVNYERAPSEEALPAGNAGAHGKPAALNAPRPRPAMVSSTSDPYRYPESQTPRDYQLPTPAINLGPLSGKFEGEAEVGVEGAGAMEGEMVEFSKAISGRKVSAAHAGTAIQDGGENYQPGFAMMTLMMAASTVTTHTRVTWTTRMQQLNALQPQAPCIPAVPIAYGPDAETPARKKATVKLGCSKCRYSRNGCGKCRPAGMVVTPLLRGRKRIRPSSAAEPSSEEPSPVHAPAPKRLRTGLEQPQQRTAQHEILPAAAAAAGAHHAQRRQLGPPHIFGNQAFLLSGFDNAERQQLQKDAKLHGGRILQSISACMEGSLEGCRVVVLASDGAKQTTKQ